MLNGRDRLFVGLGRDVEIDRVALCYGWKHILPCLHGGFDAQGLAPTQIVSSTGSPLTIRLVTDDEALGRWAPDSFDIVVIYVPPHESACDTYKQLIRVARQGLILLGATRS